MAKLQGHFPVTDRRSHEQLDTQETKWLEVGLKRRQNVTTDKAENSWRKENLRGRTCDKQVTPIEFIWRTFRWQNI